MEKNSDILVKSAISPLIRGPFRAGKAFLKGVKGTGQHVLDEGLLEGLAHGAVDLTRGVGRYGWEAGKWGGPKAWSGAKRVGQEWIPGLARGINQRVHWSVPTGLAGWGAYSLHKNEKLPWQQRNGWRNRVSKQYAGANRPGLTAGQRASASGALLGNEFISPLLGGIGESIRSGPGNAAMMGAVTGALPAALLGLARTRSLSGMGNYGLVGALGGAGMASGLSALHNIRNNNKWYQHQGLRTPVSIWNQGFSNPVGSRWSKSGHTKIAGTDPITRVYADPTLTLQQRTALSTMIQQLGPTERAALDRVIGGSFGAGVGLLAAKYLMNLGKRSVLLSTIVGGIIGAMRGQGSAQPNMSLGGERYRF